MLYILGYAFTLKIKHISRINISDIKKIVINSSEVHFGIERFTQYLCAIFGAEASHNLTNNLSKIYLQRTCRF
jgi:hypothetical protein